MAIYFTCSKEIYDFLSIVKDNQLKSRENDIRKVWKEIISNDNPKKEAELDNKYHELISIHTNNGYIIHLNTCNNEYELVYSPFTKNNDKAKLTETELNYKSLNLLKEDLLNLGFSGNIDKIYF